jgi:hypothetical protein
MVTNQLSKFGYQEFQLAKQLFSQVVENGFPPIYDEDGLELLFDTSTGDVYFSNSKEEKCMINNTYDCLDIYYSTPYSNYEGFIDDLIEQYDYEKDNWQEEDIDFLKSLCVKHDYKKFRKK